MPPAIKAAKVALPERSRNPRPKPPERPRRALARPSPAAALRGRLGNRAADQLLRHARQAKARPGKAGQSRPPAKTATKLPDARSPVTRRLLGQIAALADGTRARFAAQIARQSAQTLAHAGEAQARLRTGFAQKVASARAKFAAGRVHADAAAQRASAQVDANAAMRQAAIAQSHVTQRGKADHDYSAQQGRVQQMGGTYAGRARKTADEVASELRTTASGQAQQARAIGQRKAQAGGEPGVAEAKRKVANDISADTADKIMGGVDEGAAQISATGPEAASGFRDQATSIARQLGEGKAGLLEQISSLYGNALGTVRQMAGAGKEQIASARMQHRQQLTNAEAQATTSLTSAGEQSVAEVQHGAESAVTAMQSQAATATDAANMQVDELLQTIARKDVPAGEAPGLLRQIGARIVSAFDGLARTVAGASGQLSSQIATSADGALSEADKAVAGTEAQVDGGMGAVDQGFAQQTGAVSGQLGKASAQTNATGEGMVSRISQQLGQKVGEIDAGFDKNIGDYRNHLGNQVKGSDAKAQAPVSTLDSRITQAQLKAEERAKKGFFERQWDDFKEMVSDPGFWVGLIVGLILAIIVVVLIVTSVLTGGLAIILAFAVVGLIAAAVGSIVSQGYGGKFGNDFKWDRVDWKQVGIAALIGFAAGAALAAAALLLAHFFGVAFLTTFWGIAAMSVLSGLVTVITNVFTGQPWDKNLLANMAFAFILAYLAKIFGPKLPPKVAPPEEKPPVPPPVTTPKRVIIVDSVDRIVATEPVKSTTDGKPVMNWKLKDSKSGAVFSDVDANIEDPANPGPPDQMLEPKNAAMPDGEKVQLEPDPKFSWTDESLRKNKAVWEKTFGKKLENLSGSLAEENLANFQKEFAGIREASPGLSTQEIGNQAIRKISFGRARINAGFGDLSVEMSGFQKVKVPAGRFAGQEFANVPTQVKVNARPTGGGGGTQ